MKINLYSVFGNKYGFAFPASNQMTLLGEALKEKGHTVHLLDIFQGERDDADMNVFFPFHYWKPMPFQRVQDSVGGWHTPPMRHFQENDIPIGFADSSVFDPATLAQMKNEPYRFFGAMSHDTADIMNLPRTSVIGGTYNPEILNIKPAHLNIKPEYVVYINGTNFPVRRGIDVALQACYNLKKQGYKIHVLLRDWKGYNIQKELNFVQQITGTLSLEQHYGYLQASDIVLAPVRGGGFELQILEAMVMGKQVVIPNAGAWIDIPLDIDDVHWIHAGKRNVPIIGTDYTPRAYHSGYMFDLNPNDVTFALKQALDHPKAYDRSNYQTMYHPSQYALRILNRFNGE